MDVIQFVKDQYPILILAGLVILMVVVRVIQNRKQKMMMQHPEENKEIPVPMPSTQPEKQDMSELFKDHNVSSDVKSEIETTDDVIKHVAKVSELLNKTDKDMESRVSSDLEELKRKLADVKQTKEIIRRHGLQLGGLFKRYERREKELDAAIYGLSMFIQKEQAAIGEPKKISNADLLKRANEILKNRHVDRKEAFKIAAEELSVR